MEYPQPRDIGLEIALEQRALQPRRESQRFRCSETKSVPLFKTQASLVTILEKRLVMVEEKMGYDAGKNRSDETHNTFQLVFGIRVGAEPSPHKPGGCSEK